MERETDGEKALAALACRYCTNNHDWLSALGTRMTLPRLVSTSQESEIWKWWTGDPVCKNAYTASTSFTTKDATSYIQRTLDSPIQDLLE